MEAKKLKFSEGTFAGLMTKQEGAKKIADGCAHVHSSTLADKDPLYLLTLKSTEKGTTEKYDWEIGTDLKQIRVTSSSGRRNQIHDLLSTLGIADRKSLAEKVSTVFEELISNSIFHAYDSSAGTKYHRSENVELQKEEAIQVFAHENGKGVFLCVTDHGGTLSFENIQSVFKRCNKKDGVQIENKEQGAGLGIFMVFDIVTHLKLEVWKGKKTRISCWIPDRKHYDPDVFSFNFFQRE